MKQYNAISLENAPQEVKDLDQSIKDVSVYAQLSSVGLYPGQHSEHVTKMKSFLLAIRDQMIDQFEANDAVKAERAKLEAPKAKEAKAPAPKEAQKAAK